MSDAVQRAGRRALAFELDDLRCALGHAEKGEKMFTADETRRMERRVAELEALLDEEEVIAILAEGDD